MISIENLSFQYDEHPVLANLCLNIRDPLNIIVGPNAAGKSTLLKCLFGLLPAKGKMAWKGVSFSEMTKVERMDLMVYMPQHDVGQTALTVFETVLLGKLGSLSWKVRDEDLEITLNALKALGIENLAKRYMHQLSGGQRKLVSIAQILVREPEIILMDEPTNNLDMQKQLELFTIIKEVIAEKEIMFVIVMHDLNLSCRNADSIIVLNQGGQLYDQGAPREIITKKMLRDVYGIDAYVTVDDNDVPLISPICSLGKKQKKDHHS